MAKTTVHRLLSRCDIPLRERTLWRMLYETAARAAEIPALNVEDLDLEHRRAPVRSKGGAVEWVYWESGTAHLLPRLLRLSDGSTRTHGPLFLSERRPVPARRPAAADNGGAGLLAAGVPFNLRELSFPVVGDSGRRRNASYLLILIF